ncbi:hypothetical protein EKO27_g12068 [Xylaria grammica]|uniref:Sialidase n=1 Tax=Xylaria grammica TaxID=363999 RepID=A0A439CLJ3_9PEZI|nr:hypothetical protein EKO27_g12068 [Xylaria grammica]
MRMSSLAADMSFDFTFPSCEPVTPPSFSFDPSLLEIQYNPGHARTGSYGSICSTAETSPSDSVSTRVTTPSRSPPPIRQHGPILLPKIRSQDQTIESPAKRVKRSTAASVTKPSRRGSVRPTHTRSFTNPESLSFNSFFSPVEEQVTFPSSLICSPVPYAQDAMQPQRASSVGPDSFGLDKFSFPTYRQMPAYVPAVSQSPPQPEQYMYGFVPRAPSPLSLASTPDPTPSTTLMNYLTTSNPAPSLVRSISFPLRDPNTKHFWWDVRQIRQWSTFNLTTILSLPGASALLNCPVPAPLLPQPSTSARHPETEAALHSIYASYYIPKLNSALALSTQRALQLSVPSTKITQSSPNDHLIVANMAGESSTAAAIFGGKPTARVVGLVKSFDRFNTGMRVEGNIKRVEYLRGLAHLHSAMREHGTRYGFILTEIELVLVRNGAEGTPHFGYLEVTSVQLAAAGSDDDGEDETTPLTACLALWGLCMLAGDEPTPGHAPWKAEIGAPAEGTRRKALARDDWMPQPQLAEKREAKRSRGWVLPEDPVGRKELGKRGVRYGGC